MNSSSEENRSATAGAGAGRPENSGDSQTYQLRAVFYVPVFAVIGFLFVYIDPFGISEVTRRVSVDHVVRLLIGPSYPLDGRGEIAVVLFDEQALTNVFDTTWPPPLSVHAYVLRTIRHFEPRGVMVDFVFVDERPDDDVEILASEISAYEQAGEPGPGIPLYFAATSGDIHQSLDGIANLVNATIPVDADGIIRRYWFCARDADENGEGQGGGDEALEASPCGAMAPRTTNQYIGMTAAFRMYSDRGGLPENFTVTQYDAMDLIWSNRLNPLNDKWMRRSTGTRSSKTTKHEPLCDRNEELKDWNETSKFVQFWNGLTWFWDALWHSEGFIQHCPYTSTVPVSALINNPNDPDIKDALENKFVFYGSSIVAAADLVAAPTHPEIPGVYVHAMALDNLITFGGNYRRSFLPSPWGGIIEVQTVEAILGAIAVVVTVMFVHSKTARASFDLGSINTNLFPRKLIKFLIWFWFHEWMLIALIVVSYILYSFAFLSPINWFGLFALVSALSLEEYTGLANGIAGWIVTNFFPEKRSWFFEEVVP